MRSWLTRGLSAIILAAVAAPAAAGLVLSEVIVDFLPGQPARHDIEAWNNGTDRLYLVADPEEVLSPGLSAERRAALTDPRAGGLLVTPRRMILEPGERRLIRIAVIGTRTDAERIYRVAVRPVAGAIGGEQSGVKIMVGYDALVIVRPSVPRAVIAGRRQGRELALTNNGNSNAELYDGRQCDARGADCRALTARRIYAGASVVVSLPFDTPVEYRIRTGDRVTVQRF